MKKFIQKNSKKVTSTILALAVILSANLIFVPGARAASYNVAPVMGAGVDYTSINFAIAAASDNDTINVAAGTYTENVVVSKKLTIVGADKNTTIINPAADKTQPVLQITHADVVMSGFTVNGNDGTTVPGNVTGNKIVYANGANFLNMSNVIIQNISQYNGAIGFSINNSSNGTYSTIDIKNISSKNDASALMMIGASTTNTFTGVTIDGVTAHTDTVLTLSAAAKAIRLSGAGVTDNNFASTNITNVVGINALADASGIALESGTSGNIFSDTNLSAINTSTGNIRGIYLYNANNNTFTDTDISNLTASTKSVLGVNVSYGTNNSFTNTNISNLTGGISVTAMQFGGNGAPVSNQVVNGGTISGLNSQSATGVTFSGVTSSSVKNMNIDMGPVDVHTTTGIYVLAGSGSVIQNNTIDNADTGIKIKNVVLGVPMVLSGNVLGSGVATFIDGTGTTIAVDANNVTFEGITSPADLAARLIPAGGGAIITIDVTAPAQPTLADQSVQSGATVNLSAVVAVGDTAWLAPSGTTTFATGATMTSVVGDGAVITMTAPLTAGTYKLFLIDSAMNLSAESVGTLTVDNTAPAVTKLGTGATDYTIANTISVNLVFNKTISAAGKTAVETALTAGSNQVLGYVWNVNDDTLTITNASGSTATFADDVTANVSDLAGNTTTGMLLVDSAVAPVISGGGGGGGFYYPAPTNTSVLINNGAETTNSRTVTLKLGAVSAVSMAISNDSSFSTALWENYDTAKAWTLTEGNGTKTIYVKFKSSYGVVSSNASDSITLTGQATDAPSTDNPDTPTDPVKPKPVLGKCQTWATTIGSTLNLKTAQIKFYRNLKVGNVNSDAKSLQRFLNSNGYTVLAAESNTFSKALSTALAKFQAKNGLANESGVLGAKTREFINNLDKPSYDYELINQSPYPSTLKPGEEVNVWIEVKNTGIATWYNNCTNAVRLGSGSSYGNINQQRDYNSEFAGTSWLSNNRPVDILHAQIIPGWHTRFQFTIKAPTTPGTYKAYFTPVADGVTWMKDMGIYWQITVAQ